MINLTIVANINVKQDKIDFVKAEMIKLIDKTLVEKGCVEYRLHQDNNNPAHFIFYECWESRELWQIHRENTHLVDYRVAVEGAIESFDVNEMTELFTGSELTKLS